MYMNPTQIFDKPSTQVHTLKEPQRWTFVHVCAIWKVKPIFSIWFCISVVCAVFSSINPPKHLQDFQLMCIGISILPLQLIGVLFAESQMSIEWKSWDFSASERCRLQNNWDAVKLGFGNSTLFKLVLPLINFFFPWVLESLVPCIWFMMYGRLHRPRELHTRN